MICEVCFKILQQTINNQQVGKKDEWEKQADYLVETGWLRVWGFIISVYFCICLKTFLIKSFKKLGESFIYDQTSI